MDKPLLSKGPRLSVRPPRQSAERPRRTRGEYELNTSETRAEYERIPRAPRNHLACNWLCKWLGGGLGVAFTRLSPQPPAQSMDDNTAWRTVAVWPGRLR